MNAPGEPPAVGDADAPQSSALANSGAAEVALLQGQLAAARAELQEFVYTVTHDLRAPLRHITAFAEIIAEDLVDIPPEIASHLSAIRQSAQLLAQQLDGLAALSRLAQQEVQCIAVDMAALMQGAVDESARLHPERDVQWQLATDLPAMLGDAGLLRQMFAQLLDNALKATRGRSPASISLTWHLLDNGQCRISVQDNGIGFNPKKADKLFKVFAKLHPMREFDGLGLGLVRCRKMLARMGGSISATAEVEGGCCVAVTLPLPLPLPCAGGRAALGSDPAFASGKSGSDPNATTRAS